MESAACLRSAGVRPELDQARDPFSGDEAVLVTFEKRTGLLRCYLSRVENGHTVQSLETLQKIARALDLQLSEFFAEEVVAKEMSSLNLGEDEIRFLTQVQRYSANLSDSDRRLLLAMVRKFAQTSLA